MKSSFPPKTLGIDFGTQRIGLALSKASLVEPWQVLSVGDKDVEEVVQQIKQLCEQEQIEQVVVGLSEGEMASKTLSFVSELQGNLGIPIHTFDETLSSREVVARLHQKRKRKPGEPIDHFAAAQILEEFLW